MLINRENKEIMITLNTDGEKAAELSLLIKE